MNEPDYTLRRRWLGRVLTAAAALGLLYAAWAQQPESRRYDYGFATVGGPSGWPVYVEHLTFNDAWGPPVGVLEGGFEQRPPRGGKLAALGPMPAPRTLHARWFSHRKQVFYEIALELPANLERQIRQWFREYPRPRYVHSLVTGVSGQGEVWMWWRATCIECEWNDTSQDFHEPIVELAHARAVAGNAGRYRSQTAFYKEEGIIPDE